MTELAPVVRQYPKDQRRCNIGACPAFHLTEQDSQYFTKAGEIYNEEGMDAAIKKLGVPSGTCLVTQREVVVNSKCKVSDDDFANYFRNLPLKKYK